MTTYSYVQSKPPVGTRMLLAAWIAGCALVGTCITGVPFLLLRKVWQFNAPPLQLLVILIGGGLAAFGGATAANRFGRLHQRISEVSALLATTVGLSIGSIAASTPVRLHDDELWQFALILAGTLIGAFMGAGAAKTSGAAGD